MKLRFLLLIGAKDVLALYVAGETLQNHRGDYRKGLHKCNAFKSFQQFFLNAWLGSIQMHSSSFLVIEGP